MLRRRCRSIIINSLARLSVGKDTVPRKSRNRSCIGERNCRARRERGRVENAWKRWSGRIRPGLSNTWGISYRSRRERVRPRECVPNEGRHILTAPSSPDGNWIKPMELSAMDFASRDSFPLRNNATFPPLPNGSFRTLKDPVTRARIARFPNDPAKSMEKNVIEFSIRNM